MQSVMLLKRKCGGGGLVFVVTASVMGGDARHVFRGVAPILLFLFLLFLEVSAIQTVFLA